MNREVRVFNNRLILPLAAALTAISLAALLWLLGVAGSAAQSPAAAGLQEPAATSS